jgi:hypothetical protein
LAPRLEALKLDIHNIKTYADCPLKMRATTIVSKDPKVEGEIFKKILVDFSIFGKRKISLKSR